MATTIQNTPKPMWQYALERERPRISLHVGWNGRQGHNHDRDLSYSSYQ